MRHVVPAKRRQRGISLLVVMIVVLLSSLLALWAFRSSLVNETIVGNDADYQRAFEAAQAMVQDAELDIRGATAAGTSFRNARIDGTTCMTLLSNADVCRTDVVPAFPETLAEFDALIVRLGTTATGCERGVCRMRDGIQDFWSDDTRMEAMIAAGVGARYGEFTGALPPVGSSAHANPLLSERGVGRGAWYWVEVMRYSDSTDDASVLVLNLNPRVAYRITAIARGLKPRTQVVLQSTFVRQKLKD